MGTLFEQSPRNYKKVEDIDLDNFLVEAITLAKKHKITFTEVIEAKKVLELERKNDLYVANGDTFDEQMAGFGKLLKEISEAIQSLSDNS